MARIVLSRFAATTPEWIEHCRAAERAGLAGLSAGDTYGRDCFVDAAVALAVTERILVRVGIALPSRSPAQTANAAAALAQLGGRFTLGLGIGNPRTNAHLHGIAYDPPVGRLRAFHECVAGLLRAPAGEPVEVDNGYYRAAGTGFGLSREQLPIVFGVANPRALRLAAEIGDGVVVHLLTPLERIAERIAAATEGRAEPFDTAAGVIMSVDPDESEALRRARADLAAAFALPNFAPRLRAHAGDEVADRFAALVAGQRLDEAAEAIPEQTVRSHILVTTPERFADDVAAIPTETVMPVPAGVFTGAAPQEHLAQAILSGTRPAAGTR